ncbi:Dynein light chain 2, cytoplasmic [Linum grandiflorum]
MCIVGTDFGSFVTHCSGCFIHFQIGSLAILLFRGSAAPETHHDFSVLTPSNSKPLIKS